MMMTDQMTDKLTNRQCYYPWSDICIIRETAFHWFSCKCYIFCVFNVFLKKKLMSWFEGYCTYWWSSSSPVTYSSPITTRSSSLCPSLFGQRPQRGRWPMLSHRGKFSSLSFSFFSPSFSVLPLDQPESPKSSLEAQIPASSLKFQPQN